MVQVRRGADRAEIYSLAFSPTIQWLAVSSDKGTVHVFSLKPIQGNQGIDKTNESSEQNTPVHSSSSSLSFIKGIVISKYREIVVYEAKLYKDYYMVLWLNFCLIFILGVLPKYFSSEWSVAQFRLVEGLQHIVAFGHQKNTVVILGMDGR